MANERTREADGRAGSTAPQAEASSVGPPDEPGARVPWLVSGGATLVAVAIGMGAWLWPPSGLVSAAGVAVLALCGLGPALVWARHAARLQRTAEQAQTRLDALVDSLPVPACVWFSDRPETPVLNGRTLGFVRHTGLPGLRAALGGADAAVGSAGQANETEEAGGLAASVRALRRHGSAFRRDVGDPGGRAFRLFGAAGCAGTGLSAACVLVFDRSADSQARASAEARVRGLQAALDAAPWPVWLRALDLRLLLCNQAYARAVEADAETVVTDQRELVSGTVTAADARAFAGAALAAAAQRRTHRRVVIDGNRRLLDVIETPLPGVAAGSGPAMVGFAVDRTREDELTAELERHIGAHSAVLEQLGSAIAIYGPDTRLQFYNRAYASLWELSDSWLSAKPTFGEVLEELRTRRRLPEHADFPLHKRQSLQLFTTLIDPAEDLMHLPDGTTLRSLVVPHPFGGLMFVLEDVTNSLALESSYNTLVAVQRETLDNLAEGIAVFGGDGRLKLSNPAYEAIWGLHRDDLVGEPHVTVLLDRIKHYFDYGDDWDSFRNDMVAATLDRAERQGRIVRIDGSVIEFSHVPLPDGAVLTSYLDVSDSVRVEKALHAANAALEAADALKLGLLTNLSYHLRTPLTVILGYAEMLALGMSGPLTEPQANGLGHVLAAGRELLALTEDILDLATLEAGYVGIETRPVALDGLLRRSIAAGRGLAGGGAPSLALDIEGDPTVVLEADESRLTQALSNLIAVALRYPPRDGEPVLSVRQSRDDEVRLSLPIGRKGPLGRRSREGDQGAGRTRSVRASAPEVTDPAGVSGLGIGLTVARRLIERHGGRVELLAAGREQMTIVCVLPTGRKLQSSHATAPEATGGEDGSFTQS